MKQGLTILGGGAAGLAVAFYAHRAGVPFELYERSDEVGGMCLTFRHGEHYYDSGAHRLHDRVPDVTADLRALLGDELRPVRTPSKIYDRGRFVDFPPTPLNLIRSTGLGEVGRTCYDLVRARLSAAEPRNFEEFAIGSFGETLARRYLINYTEKVWGLPAHRLSPDVATRRLSGMTVATLVREVIAPAKKATHIDGEFLYPRLGFGRIAAAIADTLPAGSIATGQEVTGIECRDGRIERVVLGRSRRIAPRERVVSTLPLTAAVDLLADQLPPRIAELAADLAFRSLRLVFLRLARPLVSRCATIYLPQQTTWISRVHEPKNRSAAMSPTGETALVAEIPCFPEQEQYQLPEEQLAERVIDDLDRVGLIRRAQVVDWRHHLLRDAYPVYSLGYERRVREILDGLATIENLDSIGRGALFKYTHLHHQLDWGKRYVATLRCR